MNEFIKVEDGKVTINLDAVRAHLKATIPDPTEESTETGFDVNEAARGLEEVRRLFYGTPVEGLISSVIGVCSTVTEHLEEAGVEIPEEDENMDGPHTGE